MAYEAYVNIRGAKQGQFKGNSSKRDRADKWIEVGQFDYTVTAPRDGVSGQASGKRQNQSVRFKIELGSAAQQLQSALLNDEVLTTITFEFVRSNEEGKNYVYQTITMTNARVSSVGVHVNNDGLVRSDKVNVHEWSDIEIVGADAKSVSFEPVSKVSDDWKAH